ncbi:VWA domain-containing protein, partial [bacterium]|nr:VWA domain-containing protein [bacterium]
SMSSPITDYYYDEKPSEKDKTKMKLAEEAVNILIDQLKDYDSLGIVLFDDSAYLAKPLNKVCDVDMSAIKRHMLEVDARGGTNFEAGYKLALDLFDDYDLGDASAYENRIIVITDAMPNIGSTSSSSLLSMMKDAQKDNINTTFIGVGVDFNTEVVKNISNVRGANYYKVSSEEEFKTRMGEQFDYMVTPMIYDLSMTLEGDSYELVKLYGTDDIDSENSNTVMHVNTLFPSSTNSSGEVKGGVILLRLKKLNDNGNISLKMSWEEVSGKKGSSSLNISFKDNATYYDNTGIRKAIVLTRYANTVKNWISYERTDDDRYLIIPKVGIFDFVDYDTEPVDNNYYGYYSDTERTSVPLTLDDEYKTVFTTLKSYMEKEIEGIGDTTMQQEIEMLDIILAANK